MTTDTRTALAKIRAKLGVKRLDPRRLFAVEDGAYTWIGDRADLSSEDASDLRAIRELAVHPDRISSDRREQARAADYDGICGRCRCLSSTCGSGPVAWADLPEDWRDGRALGPILPLS